MRGHAEFWDTLVKVAGEGRRAESSFMGGTCNENLMSLSGHTSHITGIFIPCLDRNRGSNKLYRICMGWPGSIGEQKWNTIKSGLIIVGLFGRISSSPPFSNHFTLSLDLVLTSGFSPSCALLHVFFLPIWTISQGIPSQWELGIEKLRCAGSSLLSRSQSDGKSLTASEDFTAFPVTVIRHSLHAFFSPFSSLASKELPVPFQDLGIYMGCAEAKACQITLQTAWWELSEE